MASSPGQKLAAEFVGTGWLVLGGCGSAVLAAGCPIWASLSRACRWPSTGPALFVGGWAISQLWLFWVAPIAGAVAAGLFSRWLDANRGN